MEENSIIKDKKDKMLMIVIGCLSVVLILLFIFFLVERSENKKHIAAIHEEKQLLEQELTDLSHNYDDLKTSNDTLNEKLQLEQEKILTLMDHPSHGLRPFWAAAIPSALSWPCWWASRCMRTFSVRSRWRRPCSPRA